MDDKFHGDEVHCTCVPVLRDGIKKAEAKRDLAIEALMAFSQTFKDGICFCDAGGMLPPHQFPHREYCLKAQSALEKEGVE